MLARLDSTPRGAWLDFRIRRAAAAASCRRRMQAIRSLSSHSFFSAPLLSPCQLTAQPDLVDGRQVNVRSGSRIVEQRGPPGRRGGDAPPSMVPGPRERDGRELLRQRRRRRCRRLGWHRQMGGTLLSTSSGRCD